MRLIEFKAPNGESVFVNPEHVAVVMPSAGTLGARTDEVATLIRTDAGDQIVQGRPSEVAIRLK